MRLIDRAGDVGGTWYWNRYPAAQCDVESYIYLPLLDEMGYIPTAKYVYQPEIFAYLQSIATKFDLYEYGLFQTDVVEMAWNETDERWTVLTDRGDAIRTQFLVIAGGFLERPKLPGVPGLGEFQGKVFHSNLWDYEYTGGGPGRDGGGLPNLHDKRVALVGTGASGLQIVTPVAEAAEHLYVIQRTPVVVLPRGQQAHRRGVGQEPEAGLAQGAGRGVQPSRQRHPGRAGSGPGRLDRGRVPGHGQARCGTLRRRRRPQGGGGVRPGADGRRAPPRQ